MICFVWFPSFSKQLENETDPVVKMNTDVLTNWKMIYRDQVSLRVSRYLSLCITTKPNSWKAIVFWKTRCPVKLTFLSMGAAEKTLFSK